MRRCSPFAGWLIAAALLLGGCTHAIHREPVKLSPPVPPELTVWRLSGEQTRITLRLAALAHDIAPPGASPETCVALMLDAMSRRFVYDIRRSTAALAQTADELAAGGVFGDCTDYALVMVALARARGLPARVLFGVNAHWIEALNKGTDFIPDAHAFVEVYYDGRWHLVNPSWFRAENDDTPHDQLLPNGYLLTEMGHDFWAMGMRNVDDMKRLVYAKAANPGDGWTRALTFDPFPGTLCCLVDGKPPVYPAHPP